MVTTRSRGVTITQVMSPRREAGSPARSARSSRASEELMLPARADEAASDEAPATSQTSSTRVEQQLELLLAQFGTVMATLTNQQQMQNVPVEISTPRPQRQLIQEFSAARAQPQRVPTPYGPRRGNPSTEDLTAGASTRQGDPPRNPKPSEVAAQPVQTEAGTDSAPDEDMAGDHRCTRCMNQSGHVPLNARLTDSNYQTWRVEICSILDVAHLLDPIMERETMADQRNEGQRGCFKQRLRVAQRELTMGLSQELQMRFTSVIQRADPILLWRTLEDHFDNHPGVNSVFLKRDMLNRRLHRDERLDDYIRDIDDYQQRLRRANKPLPEQEAVSILLSNTVGVYPAVVNEHEVRIGRGESITWEQAIERLRLADHSRQETELQQGRGGGGRAVQRDVAFVGGRANGRQDGGERRNSNNNSRNNRRSRSRSSSPRGRNKRQKSKSSSRARDDIAKRKAKTKCNTCGEQGHWSGDPECRQRNSNNNSSNPPRRMVDVVTVKTIESTAPTQAEGHVLAVHNNFNYEDKDKGQDMVEWVLDSGAQTNVSSDLTLFTELHEDSVAELVFGNGTTERATVGTVLMQVLNEHTGKIEERLLDDVSYAKSAAYNLISQTYMQFKGNFKVRVSHDQKTTWLVKDTLKLRFKYIRGMYRMWTPRQSKNVMSVKTSEAENPMTLLHNRMGHVNMETIKAMAGNYNFGINMQSKSFAPYECIPCLESKTKRMSYKRKPSRSAKPLQKLCVDLCSVGVETISKSTQFLLIIDEATRYKWGYLLAYKDEATGLIQKQIRWIQNQFPKATIKMLFSDGGGEFVNTQLESFCENLGIDTRSSNPYSPQENAIVERTNQTVMRQVRSMLQATQMPVSLWGEAFLHAVETLNKTPTPVLKDQQSPYEALYGERPDLSVLRTWGCLVHAHIPDDSRQRKEKLTPRTQMCLLLGYSEKTKGYKLLNLRSGSVTTCRDGNMKAHEKYTVNTVYIEQLLANTYAYGDYDLPSEIPIVPIRTTMSTYLELPAELAEKRAAEMAKLADSGKSQDQGVEVEAESATQSGDPQRTSEEPAASVGGSKRKNTKGKKKAKACADRVGASKAKDSRRDAHEDENWEPRSMQKSLPDDSAATSRSKRKRQPPSRLKDYVVTNVTKQYVEDVQIPISHKHAARSKKWKEWKAAMQVEMDSQQKHGTWVLVRRTEAKGKRIISCKWVYALKRDSTGRIKRYKARLVIRGFLQRMGIDYSETYAPVIRFETIRCVIVYALQRGWAILQFDVKTAFLYGDLDEEVYMEQPPGFGEDSTRYVCKLQKSLYGLKQAPRVWNKTLHKFLTKIGLERLDSDYGLYARKVGGEVTMLLTVYVDDLLLLGPSDLCAKVAKQLSEEYELTSLGPVKYLLGVEILIDSERRHAVFCQRQYITEVLKRFHMEGCNAVATPEALRAEVVKDAKDDSPPPYRELVGALQYLVSASRPDIAHAVRNLSKYLSCFDHTHYAMGKRVLRYLSGTKNHGLVMDIVAGNDVKLTCYTDADYANDPDDRKSVSGFVTFVNGNVVSYGSRKQEINAQSTTEAEYIAMNEGTRDLQWLRGLCDELCWEFATPEILGDNMSCIYLTAKPGKHSKSKHIMNKFHLVRHLVEGEQLRIRHVGTDDMIADAMTKPLPKDKFEHCRDGMKVLRIDRQQGSSRSVGAKHLRRA